MKRVFLILIAICYSLFISNSFALANSSNNKINIENNNINSKNKVNRINKEQNLKPDDDMFGDEQTFPFVAGLGKNAAH